MPWPFVPGLQGKALVTEGGFESLFALLHFRRGEVDGREGCAEKIRDGRL